MATSVSIQASTGGLSLTDSLMRFFVDIHKTWWIYAGVLLPATETALIVVGSPTPILAAMRIVCGLIILGFMPGYLTMRAFFPKAVLARLEVILMSVFLSLVIAVGIGVGLGLGPYFEARNVSLTLTGYSILLALTAGYRDFSRTGLE